MTWPRRLVAAAVAVVAGTWGAGIVYISGRQDWPPPSPADAVLVLGTRSTIRGSPNPCMATRVAEGVRLVEEGFAPRLIVSGGLDSRDGLVEAETMASLAVSMGLGEDRIDIEARATSTIENLGLGRDLLIAAGIQRPRLLVVTEPFHLPRAVFAADRLGIDVVPAPSEPCHERDPTWIVREPAALIWYRVKLR